MGRNNTKAIKSIKQMYQANNLDCDKVFHTKPKKSFF